MGIITPRINGTEIGNFDIDIHRVVNIYTDSSKEMVRNVEVSLIFEDNNSSKTTRVPLSKLEDMDWRTIDDRATFSPQISIAKANRYIANDIRLALDDLPASNVFQVSHPGLHKINGETVFCTGKEVIRPPASTTQVSEIEMEPMSQQLDFDPNISEDEAVAETLNLICLFPNPGRIILSQVLLTLMRQAYEDAGKRPSLCVFLYGRSGTLKTTLASFLTQIYNRNEGIAEPTRLNTSRASAVEMLMDTIDQVKVFDDLFPADSSQVRKKQEETLIEITRYIGDGTIPTRMKGNKVRKGRPKCGVLFTGEYLIGEGSNASRLLPVEMTKPDTAILKHFQVRPLIISTFYRNFISWFIANYYKIVSFLKECLDAYSKTDLGVHERLREAHFFLNTAYALLLDYCGDTSVLSEAEITQFHDCFLEMLNQLVQEQNKRVCKSAPVYPVQENVLERIRELYQSNQIFVTNDKRHFNDEQHDGVIHKECLCLRPQALSRFFPGSDVRDIVHELDAQGFLRKGKDGLTKKISAIRGKHFYWIPLNYL